MEFVWSKKGDDAASDAFTVRLEVFVDEQGFSADIELDNIDDTAHHLTGYNTEGKAVCAARLFLEHDNIWHAGRIAVKKELRGQGAGRIMMNGVIKKAMQLGATEVLLGAQYDKAAFYEKCGFIKNGLEYLDEGYLHVEMFIKL